MSNASHIVAYENVPEPYLTFCPERDDCINIHPLKGLVQYGPYNQKLIGNAFSNIRVASIGPIGSQKIIANLINKLKTKQVPQERKSYLIDFPGFEQVFKKNISINENINIEITEEEERTFLNSSKPYQNLAKLLAQLIRKIATQYEYQDDRNSLSYEEINEIPDGFEGVDAGPDSRKAFADVLKSSKTILMNGPVGAFENPKFAEGTKAVLEAIVEATKAGATSVIGGGDSVLSNIRSISALRELNSDCIAAIESSPYVPLEACIGICPFILFLTAL